VDIAAGHTSCMLLNDDNKVFTWGRDDDAQLGRGQGLSLDSYAIDTTPALLQLPKDEKVVKMAAGFGSSCVACESGNVYWWGMK